MPQTDSGSLRGYPKATALDDLVPPAPFRTPAEPVSRTVTLHLMNFVREPGDLSPTMPHIRPHLVSARAAAGLPLGDSAWEDPADRLAWDLPRGLPWSAYPVVGCPRVVSRSGKYHRVGFGPYPNDGHRGIDEAELFASLQHLFVHLPDDLHSTCPARRRVALKWAAYAMDYVDALPASVPVTLVEGNRTVVGGRDELRRAAAAIAPWRRFEYCYAVNFGVIAMKALDACMAVPDPQAESLDYKLHHYSRKHPDEDVASRLIRSRLREHVCGILNPLWLQSLYALRRRQEVPVPFLGQCHIRRVHDSLATPEGFPFPAWIGTGRYPVRPLTSEETRSVGHGLLLTRTVAPKGDALVLSETGARFLDALHPSGEDVDMPVRWAGRDLDAADSEAMDRWIVRTFRKMKTRVNAG